jgi:redox-sensitive bicupin YhaK (pirin superfamily)
MKTNDRITVRRSDDRGLARHGWLESRHTFSFADYYDPAHMGFRSLRVINDDRIAPLGGFPTHPHRDMEIFSYVLGGRLAHRDSMGNERTLHPGEIQLMSAGSGVTHSEYNPSSDDEARLLQIWIQPRERGLTPRYTEWKPQPDTVGAPLTLLISPDGRDGSATIAQEADVWRVLLEAGTATRHELRPGRGVWLHVIRGSLAVGETVLLPGDALSTETPGSLELRAGDENVEALLFDLD